MSPRLLIRTLILCGLLTACSSRLDFFGEILSPKTTTDTVVIDGEDFSLVTFRTADGETAQPIFYIGGSGCMSLRAYMGTYFAQAPAGLEIIALEKTGVEDRAIGSRCAHAFWEAYTYDELVRRNEIALSYVLQQRGLSTIPIMGVSEGGAIAMEIAAQTDAADRLAVLGAGALPQRQELQLLYGAQRADRELQSISASPQSIDKRAFGMTNRYWSSVLDRDPARYVTRISAPTLIVIGENDQSVPVASAERAHELISSSQLIIWPEATHTFDTPHGNQRDEVVRAATNFLIGEEP